jgi:predicted RND superfamily exporter protein
MRIAAGLAAIVFSAFGTMMLHHNAVKSPDSFGIGLSVGLLMVALIAFIEFVRRR